MRASLEQFTKRLNQLFSSLRESEIVDELAALDTGNCFDRVFVENLQPRLALLLIGTTDRRVYTYASCMVLLYALYEQYVESLLMAYVEEVNRLVPAYLDLPLALRNSHDHLSARLILNLNQDKYRNRTTVHEIARRLSSCGGENPYHLNSLAYIDHNANLRINMVNELFSSVGLNGFSKKLIQTRALSDYINTRFPGRAERLRDEEVYEDLSVLVDRRNEIAHGWPSDILALPYIREIANFVHQLGQAFYEVCRFSVEGYAIRHASTALPQPIAVYNSSIVCFRIDEGVLKQGMCIAARNGLGKTFTGEILELQVNGVQHEEITAPPSVEVGCRVSIRAKLQYEYYLLKI